MDFENENDEMVFGFDELQLTDLAARDFQLYLARLDNVLTFERDDARVPGEQSDNHQSMMAKSLAQYPHGCLPYNDDQTIAVDWLQGFRSSTVSLADLFPINIVGTLRSLFI